MLEGDVNSLVLEYLERQRRFKDAEASFDSFKQAFRQDIRMYLEKEGKKSFQFRDSDNNGYSVSDVRPTKVSFDAAKLKRKAPEVYRKAVVKDRHVEDWEGFTSYMKQLGADPAMVASFIRTKETVDVKVVDAMVSAEETSMEQLEGCYEVVVSEGYIRVTEMEL